METFCSDNICKTSFCSSASESVRASIAYAERTANPNGHTPNTSRSRAPPRYSSATDKAQSLSSPYTMASSGTFNSLKFAIPSVQNSTLQLSESFRARNFVARKTSMPPARPALHLRHLTRKESPSTHTFLVRLLSLSHVLLLVLKLLPLFQNTSLKHHGISTPVLRH